MLMWTEDNWKLANAKAVQFNPKLSYVVAEHKGETLILAEKRVGEFVARLGNGKPDSFETLMVLSGEQMPGMTVRNPLNNQEIPLIPV